MEIHYVDGLAGSGKTHAAGRYAVKAALAGEKILFIQPSCALIAQTYEDIQTFADGRLPVRRIDGGVCDPGLVKRTIMEHLRHTDSGGEILLVTHAAFLALPWFHHRQSWHLFSDELFAAYEGFELRIPSTHRLITDHVTAEEYDAVYSRVFPQNLPALQAYAANRNGDEIWERFQRLSECLLSEHWTVWAKTENLSRIRNGNTEHGRYKLLMFADLSPTIFEGFASVTIMGALFQDSLLHRLWSEAGVRFQPHRAITSRLRYRQHENSDRLTILYGFEQPWAKNFRDKPVTYEIAGETRTTTVGRALLEAVKTHFGDERFLWRVNKDIAGEAAAIFGPNAIQLPNSPHGLNGYQDIDRVCVLPALNLPPVQFRHLETRQIAADEIHRAIYHSEVYQTLQRCSIRNPAATAPVTAIVADKEEAERLRELFPDCHIGQLEGAPPEPIKGKPGRPRTGAKSDAERARAHRERRKAAMLAALDRLNPGSSGRPDLDGVLDRASPNSQGAYASRKTLGVQSEYRDSDQPIRVQLFRSIYSRVADGATECQTEHHFIAQLRQCHAEVTGDKSANCLIGPGEFDPDLAEETDRGLANLVRIRGVWLDNDGGDLTPAAFRAMFPSRRMVLFNSHTPGRWRAYLPTSHYMDEGAYREIVGQIIRECERQGYLDDERAAKRKARRHGFDLSKLTPSSLFYMPTQGADPGAAFFDDHNEPGTSPIPVYQWIARSTLLVQALLEELFTPDELTAMSPSISGDGGIESRAGQYEAEWRATPTGTGQRHRAFFRLAWRLHYLCRIPIEALGARLRDLDYDGSRSRKKQIDGVIRSLCGGRYRPHWM